MQGSGGRRLNYTTRILFPCGVTFQLPRVVWASPSLTPSPSPSSHPTVMLSPFPVVILRAKNTRLPSRCIQSYVLFVIPFFSILSSSVALESSIRHAFVLSCILPSQSFQFFVFFVRTFSFPILPFLFSSCPFESASSHAIVPSCSHSQGKNYSPTPPIYSCSSRVRGPLLLPSSSPLSHFHTASCLLPYRRPFLLHHTTRKKYKKILIHSILEDVRVLVPPPHLSFPTSPSSHTHVKSFESYLHPFLPVPSVKRVLGVSFPSLPPRGTSTRCLVIQSVFVH